SEASGISFRSEPTVLKTRAYRGWVAGTFLPRVQAEAELWTLQTERFRTSRGPARKPRTCTITTWIRNLTSSIRDHGAGWVGVRAGRFRASPTSSRLRDRSS